MPLEEQLIGRYRLQRLLGSGGIGEVYLATDTLINRQAAIKVIKAEVSPYLSVEALKEAVRLFQREARAIAALDHPHILPFYDYGEGSINPTTIPAAAAGESLYAVYLVMPYRPEGSFALWLAQRNNATPLSTQDVAYFIRQAADALQHAHNRQIIHQDVKPANFLIRNNHEKPDRPNLLLADFGVASFSNATPAASQNARGTPTYMAPEQLESHPVPASDQYALAVIAYELLTGRPPFQGSTDQVMYQHLQAQPQPPSSLNPHLPAEVDAVILRALAKEPAERFPRISAFAHAFQQALQGIDVPTVAAPQDSCNTPESADLPAMPAANDAPTVFSDYNKPSIGGIRTSRGLSGGRLSLLIGLALLLILVSIGIPLLLTSQKNNAPASQISANSTTNAATVTVQTNATAQANSPSPPTTPSNPYPPHRGRLVLDDPLRDNSRGFGWEEGKRSFGSCQFSAGAYHAYQPQAGYFHSCTAYNTDFRNFAFEVQMTMISGEYAGIIFCRTTPNTYYVFRMYNNGNYSLLRNIDTDFANAVSLASGTVALNRTNLVAVVVHAGTIDVYLNRKLLQRVKDRTYTHGQIGVFTGNNAHPAEAVFSDAKVWNL
jgi:eukaryotic-like serine/threonine-protein kinase